MAHRLFKISRDVLETYNRLIQVESSKPHRDFSSQRGYNYQYVLDAAKKHQVHQFPLYKEVPMVSSALQPANLRLKDVLKDYNSTLNEHQMQENVYKESNFSSLAEFDVETESKADETSTKTSPIFGNSVRKFHSRPEFMQTRGKHDKKCKKQGKPPKKCKKPQSCPKFFLDGCECPKRKDCTPVMKIVRCKKTLTPYPSYSEACVEEFDEDPSECAQCPWKACPEVEIGHNPKKKFSTFAGARNYSTFRHIQQPAIEEPIDYMHIMHCDACKKPCRRPLSPCDQRKADVREKLRRRQEEECECRRNLGKKKPKQCAPTWSQAVDAYFNRSLNMEEAEWETIECKKKEDCKVHRKQKPNFKAFPFDPREADYEHKRKRCGEDEPYSKNPCCPAPPRRRRVRDCPKDDSCKASNFDNIPMHLAPGDINSLSALTYELKRDFPEKCPIKIKKPRPDYTIDKIEMFMGPKMECKEDCEKKKKKEDNCGVTCPENLKKPRKYKRNDMNVPEFPEVVKKRYGEESNKRDN